MTETHPKQEKKIDKAGDMSFPASDPTAHGKPTSTEPPVARKNRKTPKITKEQVESAQRGEGHRTRDEN